MSVDADVSRNAPGGALAAATVFLLVTYASVSLLAAWVVSATGLESDRYAAASLAQFLLFIGAGILVLIWTHRVVAFAHATGARDLISSPKMAVIYYFIPIANLAMPYLALRDAWKASIDPRDWERLPTPFVLKAWWTFWIISNIVGLIALRLHSEAMAPPGVAENLSIASDLTGALCAALLAVVVMRVGSAQAGLDRDDFA